LQSKNWVDSIDASDQKLARPGAPHFSHIFYFLLKFLLLLLKIVVAQAEPTNYEYKHYIKLNNGIYLNRCADIVIVSRLIQQRGNK
jgi:hypothetical protein